jgi:TorA maturation chaperone TorD
LYSFQRKRDKETIMEKISEYLRLRSKLYKLLAAPFYTESTPVYLEELKKHLPVFETLSADIPVLTEGIGTLKGFFERNAIDEVLIDSHERLFARLFLCVVPPEGLEKSICAQESPYLSPSGLIMQEPRDEIIEILVSEKVGLDKSFKEPEDHISAEFHLMSVLSVRLSEALEGGKNEKISSCLAATKELLGHHLTRWVPLLCKDLANEAATLTEKETGQYFIGIARLTEGFIAFDKSYIEELSETILQGC